MHRSSGSWQPSTAISPSYKGEAETAEQRIKLTQDSQPGDANARIDPARVLPAFEAARADFRQDPTPDRLSTLQQQCGQLYNAMIQTEVTKPKVRGIDCDPKQAAEAAAHRLLARQPAARPSRTSAGGDKLTALKSSRRFASASRRKCLADSGLPSKQTDELRTKINFIEMNRDDKAHRFVVTWNAFLDGNRLAYLALAIAIGIDSLVFMSGLFGANAVRSPLPDVPSMKARSAHQLEAIIENALLPDRFENARLVLGAMRPITQHDGYVARIVLHPEDPHAADIRRVLNAGSTIGAVRHIEGRDDAYEIRAELFEFLSIVAKKAFETDKKHVNQAELEKIVTVALMPDVGENAQVVLDSLHPITEDRGFMATIDLDKVDADHKRIVRSVLNAGSTLQVVQKVETKDATYFIHGDFYKTLARIRARNMLGGFAQARLNGPAEQSPLQGGRLNAAPVPKLAAAPEQSQLAPPSPALQSPGPQSAGPGLEDYRKFYRGELLAAIGLNDTTVDQRVGTDGVTDAADDVWQALKNLGRNNPGLDGLLGQFQKDVRTDIKRQIQCFEGSDRPRCSRIRGAGYCSERRRDVASIADAVSRSGPD